MGYKLGLNYVFFNYRCEYGMHLSAQAYQSDGCLQDLCHRLHMQAHVQQRWCQQKACQAPLFHNVGQENRISHCRIWNHDAWHSLPQGRHHIPDPKYVAANLEHNGCAWTPGGVQTHEICQAIHHMEGHDVQETAPVYISFVTGTSRSLGRPRDVNPCSPPVLMSFCALCHHVLVSGT